MKNKPDRVVELDLLRFIAAAAVMCHHLFQYVATRLGYLGVELFFLISGYVILATASNKTGYAFVVGRISRLYPSFLIAVTITALAIIASGETVTLDNYLGSMTMLPTFVGTTALDIVYWTLAIEIKFYALIFLLIVFKQIHDIERWLLAWLSVCTMAIAFPDVSILGHLALNGYGGLFAAGCLMYLVRKDGLAASRLFALMIALVLSIKQAVIDGIAGDVTETGEYFYLWIAGIVVVEFVLFLALCLKVWHLPVWTTRWGILATMGSMTYPLYLLHNVAGQSAAAAAGGGVFVAMTFGLGTAYLLTITSEKHLCPAVLRLLMKLQPARQSAVSKDVSHGQAAVR